jgi:hypothetical protein
MRVKLLISSFLFSTLVFGQGTTKLFVRHDTTLLKASDCEWMIKSITKDELVVKTENGKSVPLQILQAIEKGKQKAFDPETNKQIPAKEIFIWQMPADTLSVYDAAGNSKYKVVQSRVNPDDIPLIRIFQNWYFNISTGKIESEIKSIELLQGIRNSFTGNFLGNKVFCRIYY